MQYWRGIDVAYIYVVLSEGYWGVLNCHYVVMEYAFVLFLKYSCSIELVIKNKCSIAVVLSQNRSIEAKTIQSVESEHCIV
jgi:hypothetical protein